MSPGKFKKLLKLLLPLKKLYQSPLLLMDAILFPSMLKAELTCYVYMQRLSPI